jgi:antitoxin ParD1/3/4
VPNIDLTPEHEQFIEALVASGRFASAGEVMVHALRLMQEGEERRERFVTMLCDVSARADRDGTLSTEEVDAQLRDVILGAQRRA